MLKLITILHLIIILAAAAESKADPIVDSLRNELKNAKHDTSRVKFLQKIAYEYNRIDPQKGLEYANKGLKLAKKINWAYGISIGYSGIANNYWLLGEYQKAIELFRKSLAIDSKAGDKRGVLANYNNLGIIYAELGDLSKSIELYEKAYKLTLELKDNLVTASILNNLGTLYQEKGNYVKALNYLQKSLKLRLQEKDKPGIAACYMNIGVIHIIQNNVDQALEYYLKAMKLNREINDDMALAKVYLNIGNLYKEKKNYKEAEKYYGLSLQLKEKLGDFSGATSCYYNLGNVKLLQKDVEKAGEYYNACLELSEKYQSLVDKAYALTGIGDYYMQKAIYSKDKSAEKNFFKTADKYYNEALLISKEQELGGRLADVYQGLSLANENLGNYSKALMYYKNYKAAYDSIYSTEKAKEITKLEDKYLQEEQKILAEIKFKELQEQTQRRDYMQYTGLALLIIIIFVMLFVMIKTKISTRAADAIVFISFLILYEFVLLLLDPWINSITNNIPLYKMGLNMSIAFFMLPLSRLEKSFRNKVIYFRQIKEFEGKPIE